MTTTSAPTTFLNASKDLAREAHRTRARVYGAITLLIAVAMYLFFANGVDPALQSSFGLNQGAVPAEQRVPDWVIPSFATVAGLAAATGAAGLYQIVRGTQRTSNLFVGLALLIFIFALLVWATRDASINLAGLIKTALNLGVPITFGALAGILCERAGVANIAIEGLMLGAAMMSTLVGTVSGNLWVGLLAGMATGAVLAAIHAVLSIHYKVDQIISGTVINIFATGTTSYVSSLFMQRMTDQLNNPGTFRNIVIPGLADIPVIGRVLFENTIFTYIMFALLVIIHIGLFYTRWGLRVRAVGENPKAADTLGINVYFTRYMAVILGGLVAGIGGASFTLGAVGRFDEGMTAGKGFIGLAAMIFGNWSPFGAFGASLVFGFADSLATRLAILRVPIPSEFLLMAPYIATIIVIAGLIGRVIAPAADGQPYEK
ncbi:MAG TPA: ABC transporter permease [Anaerolineales bacterium]|nr:ABC transporter permease [Anaerolineales bacterium]